MADVNIKYKSRGELARVIMNPLSPFEDLYAAGLAIMMIACAKKGETVLESLDMFRATVSFGEDRLRKNWDQLRSLL